MVVGEDPGESKLSKARKHNIKQINEDELLDLIGSSMKNEDKNNINDLIEIDEPINNSKNKSKIKSSNDKFEKALSSTINRKSSKSSMKKTIKSDKMEIDEKVYKYIKN